MLEDAINAHELKESNTACDICRETLYYGEEYYEIEDSVVCESCLDEFLEKRKKIVNP